MKRITIKLLALVGAILPATAAAQMQPATVDGLGNAIGTCVAATTERGPIGQQLLDRDWAVAEMNPPPEGDAPSIYVSGESEALIMTSGPSDNGNEPCLVVAHIDSMVMFQALAEGLTQLFGEPMEQEEGQYWWQYDGRIVNYALTGSRDNLGIRFSILNTTGAD